MNYHDFDYQKEYISSCRQKHVWSIIYDRDDIFYIIKIDHDDLHENTGLYQISHHLMKYPVEDIISWLIL